jgi:hypothetical protein
MKKILALGLTLALFCGQARAVQKLESMRTITEFGMNDGVDKGYFKVAEGYTATCQYGVVFFAGKGFLNVLLAAKLAGKKIVLLNYDYDATSTVCTLVGFSIE